jgi:hypothetical protein
VRGARRGTRLPRDAYHTSSLLLRARVFCVAAPRNPPALRSVHRSILSELHTKVQRRTAAAAARADHPGAAHQHPVRDAALSVASVARAACCVSARVLFCAALSLFVFACHLPPPAASAAHRRGASGSPRAAHQHSDRGVAVGCFFCRPRCYCVCARVVLRAACRCFMFLYLLAARWRARCLS